MMVDRVRVFTASLVVCLGTGGLAHAYDDDDLLCRPGWSPEIVQQQLWQPYLDQRAAEVEYRAAVARQALIDQRIRTARRARAEKESRKRSELVAKRKALIAMKNAN